MTLEELKEMVANINAEARELPPGERYQIIIDEATRTLRTMPIVKDMH
jgi:hypothetical protein